MNPPKLLLDENLSPAIALTLAGEGFDVIHVRDRGSLRATDVDVFARALQEDRILSSSVLRRAIELRRVLVQNRVDYAETIGDLVAPALGDESFTTTERYYAGPESIAVLRGLARCGTFRNVPAGSPGLPDCSPPS